VIQGRSREGLGTPKGFKPQREHGSKFLGGFPDPPSFVPDVINFLLWSTNLVPLKLIDEEQRFIGYSVGNFF